MLQFNIIIWCCKIRPIMSFENNDFLGNLVIAPAEALKSKQQASSYSNQQLTFKQLKDFAKSTGFDGKFATKKELLQWHRAHSKNVSRTEIVKFEVSTKLMSIATS